MEEKQKKPIFKKWWFWVIVVVVIGGVGAAAGGGEEKKEETAAEQENKEDTAKTDSKADTKTDSKAEDKTDTKTDTKTDSKTDTKGEDKKENTEEPFETTLKAGHYTAGVDFPAGTYHLTAAAGNGNVSSSNMYSGGLNQIMSAQPDELSVAEFSNAKLEDGVVLSLSGTIELKISTDSGNVSGVKARENALTEEVQLGSGNYTAGTDFPAGVYNVTAVEGTGNVNSSNMYEGGLNEIVGTDANGLSVSEFKNADLKEGVTLSVDSCTIKLVPSK